MNGGSTGGDAATDAYAKTPPYAKATLRKVVQTMHHPKSPFSAVAKVAVSHKARASMVAAMRETLPPYPKNDGFPNIREIIAAMPSYTHSDVQHFLQ